MKNGVCKVTSKYKGVNSLTKDGFIALSYYSSSHNFAELIDGQEFSFDKSFMDILLLSFNTKRVLMIAFDDKNHEIQEIELSSD